ncbi:MAG: nickel/cobalt transporter, partial [Alphaproteobacteria bacterium]
WQRELTKRLSEEVRAYRESNAWAPALSLSLISFLYGVFHAAGPGHGKMVTTTYFLAIRAAAVQGVVMGVLIALVQACSAILIVSVLSLVLSVGASRIVGSMTIVELISYALIAGFGLYMLYGFISGRACDHHHHGPATHDHEHDHDHSHHGHEHPHRDHGHDRAAARLEHVAAAERLPAMIWRMLPIAAIAGLRPCTGAVLVLLFALANGVYFLGVISTFAMAVGVALTVSLMGLGTIWVRRLVAVTARPGARTAAIAHRTVGIVGGLLILAIAMLLFLGTWERSGFRL